MSYEFELLAIGGGSGGLAAAQRAALHGAKAGVIESGPLGGTCVNVGCVPKKVMWYAAHVAHAVHDAPGYGVIAQQTGSDWAGLVGRRDAYVKRLNGIYERNLASKDVEYIAGSASFIDAHSVKVGDRVVTARHIVIATGGYPTRPDIPGGDLGITSDGFFELEVQPQKIAVVGSGYIAVELGGMLNALGSDVHHFVRKESVLRGFDPILKDTLMTTMTEQGVTFYTETQPAKVERHGDTYSITTNHGDTYEGFDEVLWAIGRAPNVSTLNLEAAGVDSTGQGFIKVDKYQTTNVDTIFAIGDVTGAAALTPVAIAAGRRLSDRVFGGMTGRHLDYSNIATAVFTHPVMGTVGYTEPEAREAFGDDVQVFTSKFTPMYYQLTERKLPAAMKLVTKGPERTVIGCHVIGDGADEMLQGFAVAIKMGATKDDFDNTVAIHPTSAEEFVTMP
ncbi:MAG: glutathione-disulfide reductase [Gammaproteobacteria bacterium]